MIWSASRPGGGARRKSLLLALGCGILMASTHGRAQAVEITQEPVDQTVTENTWASLEVRSSGGLVNHTWYRNGNLFATGTNQIVFPIASLADAGRYVAVLEHDGQSVTSRVAVLIVQSAAPDALWLDRPFRPVAVEGMMVPDGNGHRFGGWSSAAAAPLLTYRDGQLHFCGGDDRGRAEPV